MKSLIKSVAVFSLCLQLSDVSEEEFPQNIQLLFFHPTSSVFEAGTTQCIITMQKHKNSLKIAHHQSGSEQAGNVIDYSGRKKS